MALAGNIWVAGLAALFIWWFSTGAILMVVRHADHAGQRAHLRAALFSLPVLLLGAAGLVVSAGEVTTASVYIAFLSALAVWGWFELAFLTGIITGPNPHDCPKGVPEWERFVRAWGTIAYSEMALLACLLGIGVLVWAHPNHFGLWTFAVLFFARIGAKLNVYLGVPNINLEFLPTPLSHLHSHFRIARMNAFFPVAVTLLSFAAACWMERVAAYPPGSAERTGFALLSALTALALIEHWMMVLPLQDARLWRWMLPDSKTRAAGPKRQDLQEGSHGL